MHFELKNDRNGQKTGRKRAEGTEVAAMDQMVRVRAKFGLGVIGHSGRS